MLSFSINTYIRTPFASPKFLTIGDVVSTILNGAVGVAGIIMLFLLLGAGWTIISSHGNNPEGMKKATKTATTAIVGMLVVVFAYFIVQLVEKFFFGTNTPLTDPGV